MSNDIYCPLNNKYYKWYMNICFMNQQKRGYFSHHLKPNGLIGHHIDPKSFYIKYAKDGWKSTNPDIPNNLVFLTDKEHFLVHWLLCYCYQGLAKRKMCRAFKWMCKNHKSSRYYLIAMKQYQQSMKNKISLICQQCCIPFLVNSSKYRQKYCSSGCKGLSKRGSNNPNWKGGISNKVKVV